MKQKLESDPAIRSFKDKMISNDSEADPASHLPPELLVHLGQLPITEQINKSFITSIICYGLGNFSTCAIARYQLGFLLLLSNMVLVSFKTVKYAFLSQEDIVYPALFL